MFNISRSRKTSATFFSDLPQFSSALIAHLRNGLHHADHNVETIGIVATLSSRIRSALEQIGKGDLTAASRELRTVGDACVAACYAMAQSNAQRLNVAATQVVTLADHIQTLVATATTASQDRVPANGTVPDMGLITLLIMGGASDPRFFALSRSAGQGHDSIGSKLDVALTTLNRKVHEEYVRYQQVAKGAINNGMLDASRMTSAIQDYFSAGTPPLTGWVDVAYILASLLSNPNQIAALIPDETVLSGSGAALQKRMSAVALVGRLFEALADYPHLLSIGLYREGIVDFFKFLNFSFLLDRSTIRDADAQIETELKPRDTFSAFARARSILSWYGDDRANLTGLLSELALPSVVAEMNSGRASSTLNTLGMGQIESPEDRLTRMSSVDAYEPTEMRKDLVGRTKAYVLLTPELRALMMGRPVSWSYDVMTRSTVLTLAEIYRDRVVALSSQVLNTVTQMPDYDADRRLRAMVDVSSAIMLPPKRPWSPSPETGLSTVDSRDAGGVAPIRRSYQLERAVKQDLMVAIGAAGAVEDTLRSFAPSSIWPDFVAIDRMRSVLDYRWQSLYPSTWVDSAPSTHVASLSGEMAVHELATLLNTDIVTLRELVAQPITSRAYATNVSSFGVFFMSPLSQLNKDSITTVPPTISPDALHSRYASSQLRVIEGHGRPYGLTYTQLAGLADLSKATEVVPGVIFFAPLAAVPSDGIMMNANLVLPTAREMTVRMFHPSHEVTLVPVSFLSPAEGLLHIAVHQPFTDSATSSHEHPKYVFDAQYIYVNDYPAFLSGEHFPAANCKVRPAYAEKDWKGRSIAFGTYYSAPHDVIKAQATASTAIGGGSIDDLVAAATDAVTTSEASAAAAAKELASAERSTTNRDQAMSSAISQVGEAYDKSDDGSVATTSKGKPKTMGNRRDKRKKSDEEEGESGDV